jgi:diamine N-acetyltransferase
LGVLDIPNEGEGSALRLTGEKVCLRRLAPCDLEFLYRWENDPSVWQYGDCGASVSPGDGVGIRMERFSREELRRFIENQQHDLHVTEQQRLVICRLDSTTADTPIGFIDLFDYDPEAASAGVGILICEAADRGKGYGSEALKLIVDYALQVHRLRSLWCHIDPANTASLALFTAAGFEPQNNARCKNPSEPEKYCIQYRGL